MKLSVALYLLFIEGKESKMDYIVILLLPLTLGVRCHKKNAS